MTRSDYFRPVRGGISGLCEEADDNPLSIFLGLAEVNSKVTAPNSGHVVLLSEFQYFLRAKVPSVIP